MDSTSLIDAVVRANEVALKFIKKDTPSRNNYDVKLGTLDDSLISVFKDKITEYLEQKCSNVTFSDYAINAYDKRTEAFYIDADVIPNFGLIYREILKDNIDSLTFRQLADFDPNFFVISFTYDNGDTSRDIIIFGACLENSRT